MRVWSRTASMSPLPQPRGREGVAWQNLSQEKGKGAPATAALAAIGTEDPLTAHRPSVHPRGVVAGELAVAI